MLDVTAASHPPLTAARDAAAIDRRALTGPPGDLSRPPSAAVLKPLCPRRELFGFLEHFTTERPGHHPSHVARLQPSPQEIVVPGNINHSSRIARSHTQ